MKKASNYTPAELVKLAIGAGPGVSSPAAWKAPAATGSAAANTGSAGSFGSELGKGLNAAGSAVWNNGGKQVFNNAIKPLAATAGNTLHGIGTTATGLANTAAGGIGSLAAGVGQGAARLQDAAGLTRDATSVADAFAQPMNQAFVAGLKDTAGGVADTFSGGRYDHDGTFAGPGHAGTAVEQMRSGMRDQLGRGTGFDTAFNVANTVSDLAASQAGFGGTGRAINVGAQALRNSQLAAPALNAVAQTPVVGAPAAAAGRWLAGQAPAANMFRQTPADYYRNSGALSLSDEVATAANAIPNVGNPSDRTADARAYRQHVEQAYPAQTAMNQAARSDNTDHMAVTMANDPAMRNRMSYGAVPQEVAQPVMQASGVPPELQQEYADAVSANAPQPPSGTPNVDAMTYADPAAREDLYARALTPLSEAKTPEQKAEVEKTLVPQLAEQVKNTAPPEKVQAVQAVAQDPNSPEARKAIEEGRSTFVTEQAGGDQTKLQDPEFFGSAMGMWNGLGAPGQMAFMLGVPMALIGLLSGDGLTGLLGGLGIGGLGMAGAASGMFGNQAQAATGKMLGDMGNFLGMIPDEARDASNLMPGSESSKAFEAQVAKAFKDQGPEAAQKLIDARTAQFQPLEQMHKLNPQFAHSYLMGMKNGPQSPEEAQKLYEQLNAQVAQARDPNFLRNKATDMATQQVQQTQNMVPAWMRVGARLGADYIPGARSLLPTSVQEVIDAGSTDPRVVAEREIAKRYAQQQQLPQRETRASVNIAQKIAFQQMTQKIARCWAGYEPVPGKAPYSENSCRPKSKKKKPEATKK